MEIFELMKKHNQEQIAFYTDKSVKLRAMLAIHSTALGPAIGGIRLYAYESDKEALFDLIRLSQAMTYKTAASGVNFGGGEIVVLDQPGMDKNGPTAVLNSCAKIDTLQTYNHLLNQKFMPQFLEGEAKPVFIDYLKTWREMKVPHIQFNVADRQTLEDAQERPEEYQELIVRVAGYSAYFVELSKGLQDHIIERTEHSLS